MSVTNADKVWLIPVAVILLSGTLDLAGVDGASIPCTLLALAASAAWSRTALFRSVGSRDFYVGVDGDYRLDGEVVVTCTEVRVGRWFAVQGSFYLLASFLVRLSDAGPLDVLDGAGLREEALAFLSCADIVVASLLGTLMPTFLSPALYRVQVASGGRPHAVIPRDAKTAILLRRATSLVTCR